MADNADQVVMAWWQKPQVQAIAIKALGASGVIVMGITKGLDAAFGWNVAPGEVSTDLMIAVPLLAEGAFSWWHNHPDNLIARAVKQINGNTVSPKAVAQVAAAVK
jgi:hypothetical protein